MKKILKLCLLAIIFLSTMPYIFSEELQTNNTALQEEKIDSLLPEENQNLSDKPSAHEIYLGYGYPNSLSTLFINGFTDIFITIFTGGQQSVKTSGIGVFQLGYDWYVKDGLSLGGTAIIEPYKTISKSNSSESAVTTNGIIYTILGKVKWQYGWEYVRLYHSLSLGLALNTTIENPSIYPTFAFNLTPIGVKVGKEKGVNFFAELGLGSTSLINAGISYRF